MKLLTRSLTLFLLFLLIVFYSNAQIPNPGFENWTQNGVHFDPNGWTSNNVFSTMFHILTFCEKDTDHTEGNFSCRLTSKYLDDSTTPASLGMIVSRELTATTYAKYAGFPYTERPIALCGAWKYFEQWPENSCIIIVLLTKWNTATVSRDTIGFGDIESSGQPQLTWENFICNITYYNTLYPDSASIRMASGQGGGVMNGDYIKIDNLHFTDDTLYADEIRTLDKSSLLLYPNPNNGDFNVYLSNGNDKDAWITISNSLGQCVYSRLNQDCSTHPVYIRSELPNGLYYLNVAGTKTSNYRKLIVR